jgi:hypothetical protein
MSEDVFRIFVSAAVFLALIAFVVQAGMFIGLYRAVRKMQEKVAPLIEKAEPVIQKAGPLIDKFGPVAEKAGPLVGDIRQTVQKVGPILDSTHKLIQDNQPRVAEIVQEVTSMTKTARVQVDRAGEVFDDASVRAKARIAQIDQTVDETVVQVEHAGAAMKRAVLVPVREINGIAAGISAAVSTLVHGSGKSSVDHATQDEEMFI